MEPFEDYYKILQVDFSAEPEIITAAYRRLVRMNPDAFGLNPDPEATKKMIRINKAYDVLSDAIKRKEYDALWLQRKGGTASSSRDRAFTRPKPIIDPPGILFKNMKPGETKRASFLIINTGGPYTKIHISNPDSWLKILDWHSISKSDELPLKVNIIAQVDNSGKKRAENIYVTLDDVQTHITVILEPRLHIKIKDHDWHDVEFANLNSWAQRQFNSSKTEFKGKYFEYRLEPKIHREIRDHNWHEIEFGNLNSWAQGQFNSGNIEFKGRYFEYRMNQITGKYQFRLQYTHKGAIYATVIPGKYQFRLQHKYKSAIYAP